MKNTYQLLIFILLFCFIYTGCRAQDIHPYKVKFGDFQQWEATLPGDITLKNFQPYKATYSRTYINSVGEPRTDLVIMTAQRAYWYGKSIIIFEYHDGANPDFDDTNARTQFYYLDEETLQLHLAVGPKSGTPEDYTIVRVLGDRITTSRVTTETGEVEFKELITSEPVFPFRQLRFLLWASMDLKVGDKIKLDKIYFPAQAETGIAIGIVHEQVDYEAPDGKKFRPFVIDNANNASSSILNKVFVMNEPPYIVAQGIYDADKDEIIRWWLKLESFELFDN